MTQLTLVLQPLRQIYGPRRTGPYGAVEDNS